MAVPKKRTSKRRKGMRRAHDFIKYNAAVRICEDCGSLKLSHHVCRSCGYYRGVKILNVSEEDGLEGSGLENESEIDVDGSSTETE